MRSHAEFRFYAELNDFLPPERRQIAFGYAFDGTPSVKDAIEAIGVPHPEVDLVLVDGVPADFARRLRGGERVAVYPGFARLDAAAPARLRPAPSEPKRFVLDVHLGKLARRLRLLGFDTLYRNACDDAEIVRLACDESRIVLTRDRGLLKHAAVTHGRWVRATSPREQLAEIVRAFDLREGFRPFTRCLACNGELVRVARDDVARQLPDRVREHGRDFAQCRACGKVYWAGTHYERLRRMVDELAADEPAGEARPS
jgi:uncharacterized protein with PIN domain